MCGAVNPERLIARGHELVKKAAETLKKLELKPAYFAHDIEVLKKWQASVEKWLHELETVKDQEKVLTSKTNL